MLISDIIITKRNLGENYFEKLINCKMFTHIFAE